MGYYTKFQLSVKNDDAGKRVLRFLEYQDLKKMSLVEIRKHVGGGSLDAFLKEMEGIEKELSKAAAKFNGKGPKSVSDYTPDVEGIVGTVAAALNDTLDECKWYQHENDLKLFSSVFPDALLTVRGEGEEAEDIWIKYFQAGKVQVAKAQIAFEPFDPKKLK